MFRANELEELENELQDEETERVQNVSRQWAGRSSLVMVPGDDHARTHPGNPAAKNGARYAKVHCGSL